MLSILSKKGFRIWSILLIIVIVFSIFACTVQEANAIALPIPVIALVSTIMISTGLIFTNSDTLNSAATTVYNSLNPAMQLNIQKAVVLGGTAVILGQAAYNSITTAIYNWIDKSTLIQTLTTGTTNSVSTPGSRLSNTFYANQSPGRLIQLGFSGTMYVNDIPYSFENQGFHYTKNPNGTYELSYNIGWTQAGAGTYTKDTIDHLLEGTTTVTFAYKMGSRSYYTIISTNTPSGTLSNTFYAWQDVAATYPVNDYSVCPDTLLNGLINNAVANGDIDVNDISSNVGTNSIDEQTIITVPYPDTILDDLLNKTQEDVLALPQINDVINDLSTGDTIVGEGELIGQGEGTGIFEGVGRWILRIPGIGTIILLLQNILNAILDFTKIGDFTLDFTPLKVGLTEVFPFCIPFDLLRMVTVYSATPDDFVLSIDLQTNYFVIDHDVDLSPFRIPIIFFRWVVTIWFSWILISRTRDMIKW